MNRFSFLNYLFIVAIITVTFGVIYASVQQVYRTAADDPQIQIARNINTRLQQGKSIEFFFTDTIDITQSLSPFITLFDANGKPIRSTGYLDNKLPELPAGVFEFAKSHGEDRVTWQPHHGVRMAMVIISSNAAPAGFIAAGRSLQETEEREHNLVVMAFLGWIICIGLILLQAVLQYYRTNKDNRINVLQ